MSLSQADQTNGHSSNESRELITGPHSVNLYSMLPRYWIAPYGYAAVLIGSSPGNFFLRRGYFHRKSLPKDYYNTYYVDVQHRRLKPFTVSARTLDGFEVRASGQVNYHIRQPERLVDLVHPLETLEDAARTALVSTIQAMSHSVLMNAASGGESDGPNGLALRTQQKLRGMVRRYGIAIDRVFVEQVQGDPGLVEIKHQAEKTIAQIVAQRKQLEEQIRLEAMEQQKLLQEVRARHIQVEEQSGIDVDRSQAQAAIRRIEQECEARQMELQYQCDRLKQRHEEVVEAIRTHGQLVSAIVQAMRDESVGVSSRRRPDFGTGSWAAALAQSMQALGDLINSQPSSGRETEEAAERRMARTFWEALGVGLGGLEASAEREWIALKPIQAGCALDARWRNVPLQVRFQQNGDNSARQVTALRRDRTEQRVVLDWLPGQSVVALIDMAGQRLSETEADGFGNGGTDA